MRSEHGFTLIELMIVTALLGITAAIAVPTFIESNARNSLWTSAERIGSTVRQTRLKAISQNTPYRVVFNCPSAGRLRSLVMTGDPLIDDGANRCNETRDGDSGIVQMATGVAYTSDTATALHVTGRGIYTAIGDSIPLTISVNYGATARTLTVSATGQITFTNVY